MFCSSRADFASIFKVDPFRELILFPGGDYRLADAFELSEVANTCLNKHVGINNIMMKIVCIYNRETQIFIYVVTSLVECDVQKYVCTYVYI